MIYLSKGNPNSKYTAKKRDKPSLPLRILITKKLISEKVLDFGCGHGKDVDFLQSEQINATGYDPFFFPNYPEKKFDTIICFYVLNILLPEEQAHVIMSISELLHYGGKAYFAVRRDIKKNDFIFNPKYKVKTYRCNVTLPFKSIYRNENTEIYEYQHYNVINSGKNKSSPFFYDSTLREIITESATALSFYDKYPISKGHTLIIPKRIVSDFFNLSYHEQKSCLLVLDRTKKILQNKFHPDGFNIGLNIGKYAGQTIDHTHIHLIPRYEGDVHNPRGGVRNIIPELGDYPSNEC